MELNPCSNKGITLYDKEKQDMQEQRNKALTKTDLIRLKHIFRFIRPYRVVFAWGNVFLLLSSATALVFPFVTGKLVDAATGHGKALMSNIDVIALGLIAVLILQSIFSYLRVWLFAIVSEQSMADIRRQLYEKMIGMPVFFFEQRRVGELISRITTDVAQLQETLSFTLAEFFRQVATILVGISLILVTSTRLTLLMLATFPGLVLLAIVFGRYIRKMSGKTQDALAEANVIVEETFQAIHVVKAFTNERYEAGRYRQSMGQVVRFALQAARYRGAFISFVIFGLFGGIVLVLWYGAHLVSMKEITIGELTAFIIYTTFIGGAVGGIGEVYGKLQKTVGASERIIEIMEEIPEIEVCAHTTSLDSERIIRGDITYREVYFEYPSRKDMTVLKGISFDIRHGEKVALVGPSGAGKSTIIQLLLRYYDIEQGEILIDGCNIKTYHYHELRKSIGIVPQDPILFGGTIRENILYGNIKADEKALIAAARQANALQFIECFPDGFDTLVGERGVKLSGGQKQRIAIARAILRDPKILILDEATSSLDAENETLVQQALQELMKNRTTIMIAHRLSTVRKADRILVIDKGMLVESGSHEQLMANTNGLYHHLVKLQFQHDTGE